MKTQDLKLSEIKIFLLACQQPSVRELSRNLGMSAGQISKTIQNLEIKLQQKLFLRSVSGLALTPNGQALQPTLRKIQDLIEEVGHPSLETKQTSLSIASTAYFSSYFLPTVLSEFAPKHPGLQLEILDISPDQLVSAGLRQAFEICIYTGEIDWPKTFSSDLVGTISWRLYGRKGHPLTGKATLNQILEFPFTRPVYWSHQGKVLGTDHFPFKTKKRISGLSTTTAVTAAQMISKSDILGFLPSVVASPLVHSGELMQIHNPQIKPVKSSVFMTVKADVVKEKIRMDLNRILKKYLSQIESFE